MLKKLIFIFIIFCCATVPAHGLTLKVKRSGDAAPLEIPLHTTKRTEHSLAVKTTDGTIYYADMEPVAQSFPGGVFARIDSQIYQIGPTSKFFVTTTPDTNSFSFSISAAGNFTIVWGDGAVQEIVRTDTEQTTYSHTYATAGAYTIGIGGQATGYNSAAAMPAISFMNNQNVGRIRGSLGAIFSTIGDGSNSAKQPSFARLFNGCRNLSGSIPQNLFTGINGQPVGAMFDHLFDGCYKLTGSIPEKLFAGIQGHFNWNMFTGAFSGCAGLTGSIPNKLFAGLSGQLFGGVFWNTFYGCSGLTGSIPDDLFGNISGAAQIEMFKGTFSGCTGLTGQSAKINGKYLYEIWPDATEEQVGGCYYNDKGLTDYSSIPANWK